MRIVVDAMGTDERPVPDIEGGVMAAREFGDTIIFVGDKTKIEAELVRHSTSDLSLEVVHAAEEILMDDKPSIVMKSKPESSMHVGMALVKDGKADAFMSCGNSGATHAIATLRTLRRIPGVKRPALTAIYPFNGKPVVLLDVGANADVKVEFLQQFALMGHIYAKQTYGIENPRVATLSNGEEEGKGNELTKEAQIAIQSLKNIHYIGHIEPKEMSLGYADVIVMDGFVGNILIKTFEASISYFTDIIRQQMRADLLSTTGALLARGAFKRIRNQIDPREVGGGPLLGVNGVVIIGHGSSDAFTVRSAILQARKAVEGNTVEEITRGLEQLN